MDRRVVMLLQPTEALIEVIDGLGKDVGLTVTAAHMLGDRIILLCGLMLMVVLGVLDKARAEERYNGHRDDIGAEERDDHSKRERREEVLADAGKQDDGKEDNGRAEGSRQHSELQPLCRPLATL